MEKCKDYGENGTTKKREETEGKGRVAGRGAREEEGRWTRKKGEMKRER